MRRLLKDIPKDEIFYRGTIVIIKDGQATPKGNCDIVYAMINSDYKFQMLDLYRSIGGIIILDMEPNVKGHVGVNKEGIYDWIKLYYNTFYLEEIKQELIDNMSKVVYIDDLSNYFAQSNRDLFMYKNDGK